MRIEVNVMTGEITYHEDAPVEAVVETPVEPVVEIPVEGA